MIGRHVTIIQERCYPTVHAAKTPAIHLNLKNSSKFSRDEDKKGEWTEPFASWRLSLDGIVSDSFNSRYINSPHAIFFFHLMWKNDTLGCLEKPENVWW